MGATRTSKKDKKPLLLAFDLGGTKLASTVTTLEGKILADPLVEAVDFSGGAQGFIKFLARRAKYWCEEYPQAVSLGIASCGPLDVKTGELLQPTNFPKWGHIPLVKPLQKILGIPVAIQNDAAAAALAEGWLGGAKKLQNWIVLTLGTGLGTGIVMNRQLFMGGSQQGPEAGHMILTDKPYPCGCGNYGCAEAVLSGTGLMHRIYEKNLPYANTRALVKAVRAGNLEGEKIFFEYSEIFARLVHNLAVPYKPQKIFIAGGLSEAVDLFLNNSKRRAKALLRGRPGFYPTIEVSSLKENLGVLGGAWVARLAASYA